MPVPVVSVFLTAVSVSTNRPDRGAGGRYHMHVGEFVVGEGAGSTLFPYTTLFRSFGDRTDEILRGDHRRVVGAGDGDVDLLGDQTAVLVVERSEEDTSDLLALSQIVYRRMCKRVGPGQLAADAGAGRIGILDRRQRVDEPTRSGCRWAIPYARR